MLVEKDDSFKGYASGNDEPGKGFGHICIAVDNLEAAVKRFDAEGVKFKKRPEEGKMRVSTFLIDYVTYGYRELTVLLEHCFPVRSGW